jgi:hypothetical protein
VTLALGVACVLGYAMLASSSIQAQLNQNVVESSQADYLAESGVQIARYYLENPAAAPSLATSAWMESYWPGQSNMQLWPGATERVTVTVTPVARRKFQINSTATGVVGGSARSAGATVELTTEYRTGNTFAANGSFAMPVTMSITGNVRVDGNLTGLVSALLNGVVQALNGTAFSGGSTPPTYPVRAAPAYEALVMPDQMNTKMPSNSTRAMYTWNGSTYYADQLPTSYTGTLTTANSGTNPLNVWYSNRAVTLTNLNLTGTLVMRTGTLNLRGTCTIKPAATGMPALIVKDDVSFYSLSTTTLKVDGLTWVGGAIGMSGATNPLAKLEVNGALLMAGSTPAFNSWSGLIIVKYDADKAKAPELSYSDRTVLSSRIVQWTSASSSN